MGGGGGGVNRGLRKFDLSGLRAAGFLDAAAAGFFRVAPVPPAGGRTAPLVRTDPAVLRAVAVVFIFLASTLPDFFFEETTARLGGIRVEVVEKPPH